MSRYKAYQKKAERLEVLILDFTKWLDKNYKIVTVDEIKIYWKKIVEDYVFESISKVMEALEQCNIKVKPKEGNSDGRVKG